MDNAIHCINHFPVYNAISFPNTYPMDGDSSSKKTQFPRVWGVASWGLFPGALSKTGELSKTNSCSFEQAIIFFLTVNGILKQELLFSFMIFY